MADALNRVVLYNSILLLYFRYSRMPDENAGVEIIRIY